MNIRVMMTHTKKEIYLIAIITMFFPFYMTGQERILSLDEAVASALQENYSMSVRYLEDSSASINNNWATAGALPTINVNGQIQNNVILATLPDSVSNFQIAGQTTLSGSAGLSWILFNGFKVRLNKKRLEQLEHLTKGATHALLLQTVSAVVINYHRLRLEQDKLALYKQVLKISEDRYQQQQHKRDIGGSSSLELLQSKNDFLNDQSTYIRQKETLLAAKKDLLVLIQREYNLSEELRLSDSLVIPTRVLDVSQLQAQLTNNPNLKNQYINLKLADIARSNQKANYWPTVSLNTSVNLNYYSFFNRTLPAMYTTLALNWKLTDFGVRKRAIRVAELSQQIEQLRTDQMLNELKIELDQEFARYEINRELASIAEEIIETATLNLQVAQEQFKNGLINSFNFRDAQVTYLTSVQNSLNALFLHLTSYINLLTLTGQLTVQLPQ